MHKCWDLVCKQPKSEAEQGLLAAITILSCTMFAKLTLEDIYDLLTNNRPVCFGPIQHQLNRMEETLSTVSSGVARLQTDDAAIKQSLADLTAAFNQMLQNMTDAEARLEADIAALRNVSGSGDPAAIEAVADSMEVTKGSLAALTAQLTAIAQSQATVDVPAAPVLSISPSTVTVVRTGSQQFTASIAGSTFTATSGSVDATGLYSPPTDTTILSDTVTATSPDGKQTAVASVSISG